MRLITVPYLNSIPLIHEIPCEILKVVPSRMEEEARFDDILLAPIVTPFANPGWYLLEGVGIGSFGKAQTVKLFFKNGNITIRQLKNIYVDNDSMTSVSLLKAILFYYYKISPTAVEFTTDKKRKGDASLLIGDKVWNEKGDEFSLDLGLLWKEWTNLPFVFACWMTKNPDLAREWKPLLIDRGGKNLNNLDLLVKQIDPRIRERTLNYWQRLCFKLGPDQKKGINRFQKYWAETEKKPKLKLQWV